MFAPVSPANETAARTVTVHEYPLSNDEIAAVADALRP